MTPDQLKRLKLIERAELRRQGLEDKTERRRARKAGRKARWRARWARWVAFWEKAAVHLKTAGLVVGGALAVAKGVIEFADTAPGRWVGHKAHRMWSFYADRDVGPAAQPPPTGAPSTALDFPKTQARPSGPEQPR